MPKDTDNSKEIDSNDRLSNPSNESDASKASGFNQSAVKRPITHSRPRPIQASEPIEPPQIRVTKSSTKRHSPSPAPKHKPK